MYLKAVCGSSEGMPAKLQVYEDSKSVGKGKSLLYEIFFTDIKFVDSTEETTQEGRHHRNAK